MKEIECFWHDTGKTVLWSGGSTDAAMTTTKPPVSRTTAIPSNPHRVMLDLALSGSSGNNGPAASTAQHPQTLSLCNHPAKATPTSHHHSLSSDFYSYGHSTTVSVSCMESTIPFLLLLWLISGSFPESSLRWKDRGEVYPLTILMDYPDAHSRTP